MIASEAQKRQGRGHWAVTERSVAKGLTSEHKYLFI
jgi:hypothetical protein